MKIEDCENWYGELIFNAFEKAFSLATQTALLYIDPDNVTILAPKYIIDRLSNYNLLRVANLKKSTINKYRGFELRVGYENKIIIFHESVALRAKTESNYFEYSLEKSLK